VSESDENAESANGNENDGVERCEGDMMDWVYMYVDLYLYREKWPLKKADK